MSIQPTRTKDMIEAFRRDPDIIKLLARARRIHTGYKLYKKELMLFVVGAPNKFQSPEDFEAAIIRLHKTQAYLDRMNSEQQKDLPVRL